MSSAVAAHHQHDVSIRDTVVRYRTVNVDKVRIFYREAGAEDSPALLLLHGFPTTSHMFRDLIPRLADRFLDTGHFALETHGAEIATAIALFEPLRQLVEGALW